MMMVMEAGVYACYAESESWMRMESVAGWRDRFQEKGNLFSNTGHWGTRTRSWRDEKTFFFLCFHNTTTLCCASF